MRTIAQLISEYQKDEEQGLEVFVKNYAITFQLSKNFAIECKNWVESTIVRYEKAITPWLPPYIAMNRQRAQRMESNDDDEVIKCEGNMIQVFCEYLMKRNTILASLQLDCFPIDTDWIDQIFQCMELALKSRSEKFRVKSIQFKMFDTEKIIAILQLLNPEDLMSISFNLSDIDGLYAFLVNWNRGCRLDVNMFVRPKTQSLEKLMIVKKMLEYPSTFSQIKICNEMDSWSKEQLISVFKPFKPAHWDFTHLQFELKNPLEEAEKQAARLRLQDVRSLKVFANPLLMGTILKKLDYFDIQCLRKVSRDIRSCIDTLKPDPHIKEYSITQKISDDRLNSYSDIDDHLLPLDTFFIRIKLRNDREKWIRYRSQKLLQNEDDWHLDEFVYCGDQLIERVVNDFKLNVQHQKSRMDVFQLQCDVNMFKLIGNVLESRDTTLSVKESYITVANLSETANFSLELDSETIKFSMTRME